MHRITTRQILHQLKADLFGKDSYRGVTLTYSWLANQVGHFSLGFIPTLLTYLCLERWIGMEHPIFLSPIIVCVFWLLFELCVLCSLIIREKSVWKKISARPRKYIFPISWYNLVFDTFTDLCFFWLGACMATLMIDFTRTMLVAVVGLLLVLAYPACYWYRSKMYQQTASFPVQLRLSQLEGHMSRKHKRKIYSFRDSDQGHNHLFIFGSKRRKTTNLAVGLATDMAIKRQTCIYTTAIKLFGIFTELDEQVPAKRDKPLWTWRDSSVLVVDDIIPGSPVGNIRPETFIAVLNDECCRNGVAIRNRSIIWVMGEQKDSFDEWKGTLINLGICEENILEVDVC